MAPTTCRTAPGRRPSPDARARAFSSFRRDVIECVSEGQRSVSFVRVRTLVEENQVDLSLERRHEDGHAIIGVGGDPCGYPAPKARAKLPEIVGTGSHTLVILMEKVEV